MKVEQLQIVEQIENTSRNADHLGRVESDELENTLKILLHASGPVVMNEIEFAVEKVFESTNLYAVRPFKRGCVKWRKKVSIWSLPNTKQDMRDLVRFIFENMVLEKELIAQQNRLQEAQTRLDAIHRIYEKLKV